MLVLRLYLFFLYELDVNYFNITLLDVNYFNISLFSKYLQLINILQLDYVSVSIVICRFGFLSIFKFRFTIVREDINLM